MSHLLDTNIASSYIRGNPGVMRRLRAHPPSLVAISSITRMELRFGAERRNNPSLTQAVAAFVGGITVCPFDEQAADAAGRLRARLERRGARLGYADALIAAHALALGWILVTSDQDFARVEGLELENWASD